MPNRSLLDSLDVKTPCTESWDEMFGNKTVRFCSHCAKDVHNLSEMTRADALKLVVRSKGNICVRFVKQPDGKMQTADRPLYQIGRRARIAAGVAAATLSLSAMAYSQGEPVLRAKDLTEQTSKKPQSKPQSDPILVTFKITDQNGAVIPGASITLTNLTTNYASKSVANGDGLAVFKLGEGGKFQVTVVSQAGFEKVIINDLSITQNLEMTIVQEPVGGEGLVGVISCDFPGSYLDDAISENNYERVREALKEGAELNPKDAELPPLHQAVILGNLRIVKLLLDYGANPNLRSDLGKVPLDYAETDEMRDLLEEYGAKEF